MASNEEEIEKLDNKCFSADDEQLIEKMIDEICKLFSDRTIDEAAKKALIAKWIALKKECQIATIHPKEIEEKDKIIATKQLENDTLKQEHLKAEEDLKNEHLKKTEESEKRHKKEIEDLEQKHKKEIEDLEKKHSSQVEQLKIDHNSKKVTLEEKLRKTKSKKETLQEKSAEYEIKIKKLNKKLEEDNVKRNSTPNLPTSATCVVMSGNAYFNEADKAKSQKQENIKDQEISNLKMKISELEKQNKKKEKQIKKYEEDKQKYDQVTQKRLEEKAVEISDLTKKNSELTAENKKLHESNSTLTAENESLKEQNSRLLNDANESSGSVAITESLRSFHSS